MNPTENQKGGILSWLQNLGEKAWAWIQLELVPWARQNPKPAAVTGAVAGVGVLLWIGSTLLTNGLVAGLLISGGFGVLIWKMGKSSNQQVRRAYNAMVEHPLGTDVVISLLAFIVSPAGITGWVAAGVAGLVASVWLAGAKPVEVAELEPVPALASAVEEGGAR